MQALKSIASRIVACTAAGVALCTCVATAQMFESVHGSPYCPEAGRGVIPASQGGYMSVGETYSRVDDCSESDIYIVRSRDDGSQLWAQSYNLGGNDSATSIKEVFYDPTGQEGFIITGVTENRYGDCNPTRNAFLLRIDYCGNVLWVNTYGFEKTDEIGWEVVESPTPNEEYGTGPGDFIVAGSTTYPDGGSRNGYIIRAEGTNGNLIWDRFYPGPDGGDDYFHSLDIAVFNAPYYGGDIVAAGGTDSYGAGNQGWIVRVNANDGYFHTWPHNTVAYGGDDFEEFRSIRELRIGCQSELVAVGTSLSLTGNNEVYVVETGSDPCEFINSVTFGNFQGFPDEGYSVREIPFDGPYYKAGDLIVTGYMWALDEAGQQHREDVFLQVLECNALNLLGATMFYGGSGTDWGWCVEPVDAAEGDACRSRGFIVTGFTQSQEFIGSDPQQLYLIKTDEFLEDHCTAMKQDVHREYPTWDWPCTWIEVGEINRECRANYEQWCMPWWCRLCYDPLKTEFCDLENCSHCDQTDQECYGEYGPAKRPAGSAKEAGPAIISLSSFPNPVKKGDDINLKYTLLREATMSITVNDLAGKAVHTSAVNGNPGDGSITINTGTWTPGAYVVSVKIGDRFRTTRVIVTH